MKTKTLLLVLGLNLIPLTKLMAFECHEVAHMNKSRRLDCKVETPKGLKVFHILELKGKFADAAYDHGYLLSKEASGGLFREVEDRFQKGLHEGSLPAQKLKSAVVKCYLSHMKHSVSSEFMSAVNNMASGIQKGSAEGAAFSTDAIERGAFGIELSIATEGLARNIQLDPVGTFAELGASCGLAITLEGMKTFLELATSFGGLLKLGCLGLVAPGNTTADGALLHARNLDGDLAESWNKAPTLFLVEEPGFYKFVAAATGGMLYPGGVSGFNEKGIAVSLHEMSTNKYGVWYKNRSAALAPFMQQRILREAATLDQAIALIQKTHHFGGWTFLVSDSKSNEVASIEVSGEKIQVARKRSAQIMGQSNHFLGNEMQDQFFTYNFNKLLESQSRLLVAENSLGRDAGKIDVTWAIDHLAGHTDAFEGFRSFGRTATKVYTLMSTIAIPNRNQFWITSGDRIPASHSPFLGFQIDWNSMTASPIGQERVKLYDQIPHWEESLEVYGEARLAFEAGDAQKSMVLLSKAIALAREDGRAELPYHFMRARVAAGTELRPMARRDYEFLWANRKDLHEYQQALVAMYSVAINPALLQAEKDFRLHFARSVFQKLQNETHHFDLNNKIDFVSKLEKNKLDAKTPVIDFVTVQ